MNLIVKPVKSIKGAVNLPASKSYSIRAFIIAACGGRSKIANPSDCDDAKVSISVARALGSSIIRQKNNVWKIKAQEKLHRVKQIDVGESGTTLRFLLPLLPLRVYSARVIGKGTLRGRPNRHLIQALRSRGVNIKGQGRNESIPIVYKGGSLKGGKISIDGSLSSQFVSALLIACPKLKENTTLEIKGRKLVSGDYITMTQQILRLTGVSIRQLAQRKYLVRSDQTFKGLKNYTVPSDYGLAAFLMAAAALIPSKCVFRGHFDDRFVQADGAILSLLKKMGVKLKKTSSAITVGGPFLLKGGNFSLKDCPDLVPIMAILALFAKGQTRLYNIAHVRVKESDRISDLRKELLKIGAKVKETRNELKIIPQKNYKKDVILNPHQDHRLAMSFAVLGLRLGVKVKNIECSHKSYPGFVRDLKKVGAKVKKVNRV